MITLKLNQNEKPSEIFKMLANAEAEINCQLFSDPTEKNRLEFTQSPSIPIIKKEKVIKHSIWWINFFLQLKP